MSNELEEQSLYKDLVLNTISLHVFPKTPFFLTVMKFLIFLIKNILMGRNYSPNQEVRKLREKELRVPALEMPL